MLDLKQVLANPDAVRANCRARNVPPDILDDLEKVLALETERKALLQEVESVRRHQNEVAQSTGREKDAARRGELVAEGKRLKAEVSASEERLKFLDQEVRSRLGRVPNLTHP